MKESRGSRLAKLYGGYRVSRKTQNTPRIVEYKGSTRSHVSKKCEESQGFGKKWSKVLGRTFLAPEVQLLHQESPRCHLYRLSKSVRPNQRFSVRIFPK